MNTTVLPKFNGLGQGEELWQEAWKNIIDPVLQIPPNQGIFIKNKTLKSGLNVINTTLGRTQQGWIITDINSPVTIYRSAAFNQTTLTLTASGAVTISLWVY